MSPSLFSFALVRAFDLDTPFVDTKEEFLNQQQAFLNNVQQASEFLSDIVQQSPSIKEKNRQRAFDALISFAHDASLEALIATGIIELLEVKTNKHELKEAFYSMPPISDTINPALLEYMNLYKIHANSRRWFEYQLFLGFPFFMAGRNKLPNGSIKFSPYPLHPIFRWLYYR